MIERLELLKKRYEELKFVQDVYVQEKLRELNNFIIIN